MTGSPWQVGLSPKVCCCVSELACVFIIPLKSKSARSQGVSQGVPVQKSVKPAKPEKKGSQRQPILTASDWITKAEAARVRGVTRQAIGKLVKKGKFRVLELAGHTFLSRADVESYQAEPGGRPGRK